MLGWKPCKYYNETDELPNPRKKWLKSGVWAIFAHGQYFSLGWDWFYIGNRLQEIQPNQKLRKHPMVFPARVVPCGWEYSKRLIFTLDPERVLHFRSQRYYIMICATCVESCMLKQSRCT